MEFFRRLPTGPRRLGILPGTFNPPTRAHVALGEAALGLVDEVLFVMPRRLPHKSYEGVGLADRLRMVESVVSLSPRFSLASTEQGLFAEIARECRQVYGPEVKLAFVCGRDAAERAVGWDYGEPGAFRKMLDEFELLVAARKGAFRMPSGLEGRIHPIEIAEEYEDLSASMIRARIRLGEPWEHLVPPSIVAMVRELYAR
ncbi:MAG: nicotinate-nicotinamide nucleotide adenylyltransferase [Bryobacteraceae bacterium]